MDEAMPFVEDFFIKMSRNTSVRNIGGRIYLFSRTRQDPLQIGVLLEEFIDCIKTGIYKSDLKRLINNRYPKINDLDHKIEKIILILYHHGALLGSPNFTDRWYHFPVHKYFYNKSKTIPRNTIYLIGIAMVLIYIMFFCYECYNYNIKTLKFYVGPIPVINIIEEYIIVLFIWILLHEASHLSVAMLLNLKVLSWGIRTSSKSFVNVRIFINIKSSNLFSPKEKLSIILYHLSGIIADIIILSVLILVGDGVVGFRIIQVHAIILTGFIFYLYNSAPVFGTDMYKAIGVLSNSTSSPITSDYHKLATNTVLIAWLIQVAFFVKHL